MNTPAPATGPAPLGDDAPATGPAPVVAILGTGLIGGSLGLALRAATPQPRVIAYDRDQAAAARAVERGAADQTAPSASEAVRQAGVVFIATPVGAIPAVAAEIAGSLAPGAIVSDVGSTKSQVVAQIEPLVEGSGATFIGGHPMAGTENEGIEAAEPHLFEGAWWILTPTASADPASYQRLHALLAGIGARVMAMDPARHDDLLSLISHLPHLTATALMTLAAERGREHAGLLALAAGGFRDVTRVAASNPEIWLDICRENREAIAGSLEALTGRLEALKALVLAGDAEGLRERFLAARQARRDLPGRRTDGALSHVLVPIPDHPGALAQITTLAGDLGINIEDLEISHSVEGGRGELRLTIAGEDPVRRLLEALAEGGFDPKAMSI